MKKLLIGLLLICMLLSGCAKNTYREGIACSDISTAAVQAIADGLEYTEYDDTHKEFYFSDSTLYDDCSIVYSTDVSDINEIGVFHAIDEKSARSLEDLCRAYLEKMREGERAFIESYAPHELPKLEDARAERYGCYVIYCIASPEDSEEIFKSILSTLKK
jgi:predicted small secreted protein